MKLIRIDVRKKMLWVMWVSPTNAMDYVGQSHQQARNQGARSPLV